MKLGVRVVVVKGQPKDPGKRYGLEITADAVRVVPADEYKGQWNYALCENLGKKYATASFITIGPAGEMRLTGASVACTDGDSRHPARHAARGGLGAVMGSKGLKYVSVDAVKRPVRRPADMKSFMEFSKTFTRDYLAGPQMFKTGTSSVVPIANMLNTFPTRNRTSGQFEHAKSLDGARIVESFATRGGGMHNCMTGCIVKCSNVVHDAEGNYKTSALEFETLTMLGANCGIASWEDVADLDRLCDELGLDTIETGAAIAVYMDSGGMEFGDAEGAKRILREIAEGTELGKAIGNGTLAIGKKRKHGRDPGGEGPGAPGLGSAAPEGHRRDVCHEPHGRRPHGGPDREPRAPGGPVRPGIPGVAARECGLRFVGLLPVPAADRGRSREVLLAALRRGGDAGADGRPRMAVPGR